MDQYRWKKEHTYMLELLGGYDKKDIREFLTHAELDLVLKDFYTPTRVTRKILKISVDPYIYRKYHPLVPHFIKDIATLFAEVTQLILHDTKAAPNLEKFHILQNDIITVVTPWEEINKSQEDLLRLLRTSSNTLDYQNIGNSSRTVMQKLSDMIFDPDTHVAEGLDLGEGKFKNRLHAYIKTQLGNHQQEELRKYIEAIISATAKGIDLMNKVTHDLNTNSFYAESCVIGVVTSIGLVKLVQNMPKQ
jgi:hypothetical protein